MEIERKFLIKQLPNLSNIKYSYIEQCYLGFNPEIRIRKLDSNYTLTIKSSGDLIRDEIEINIDKLKYQQLKIMANPRKIIKKRYFIPYDKYILELDVYKNIKNLITVEVEFENINDANDFIKPDWFGDELTDNKQFKNKNLVRNDIMYE